MKTALEKYWANSMSQNDLMQVYQQVTAADWELQAKANITRIGIDGTLYDQVIGS